MLLCARDGTADNHVIVVDASGPRQVSVSAAMAAFQPTAEQLRARVGADYEIVARPDLLLSTGGAMPEFAWSSVVHWVRWTEAHVDAGIDEVLEFFRARRQAFVWLVTDLSTPPSLGDHLVARGFIHEMECRMLVAELPITGLRVNPEVRIEMVSDRAGLRDGLRVDHSDWDDARVEPQLEDRLRRLGPDFSVAVGYLDGKPVGTARWRIDRSSRLVHFAGAVTLPEYRSRGVYSSLVAFRTAHAMRVGCTRAAIIANGSTSAPVLLKRGFADLGRAAYYLWPSTADPHLAGKPSESVRDR